jgi:hypothetical protein
MLLCSESVFAYTQGNSLANISYSLVATDETSSGIVYTPDCLIECHLPIKIKYGGSLLPSSILLNPSSKANINWLLNKTNLSDDIALTDIKVWKNVSYNITVSDYIPANTTHLKNESSVDWTILDNCYGLNATHYYCDGLAFNGTHQETQTRFEWTSVFNGFNITKNNWLYVDFIGVRSFSSGNKATDLIPTIYGYSLPELAWWNSTYGTKKSDKLNYTGGGSLTGFPYLINGSGGFTLNSSVNIFAWTYGSVNGTNYLYSNDYNSYAVVDGAETTQVPHEVEKGNGTSYNPKSVWDNNYVLVYHFKEGSGTVTNDSSPAGNNGTVTSGKWTADGKIGNSFMNDDSSGTVRISDSATLTLASGFTLETWVKILADKNYHYILQKDNTDTGGAYFMRVIGGEWDCAINGLHDVIYTFPSRNDYIGKWLYVVCTWDGTDYKMFIDGVLKNTTANAVAPTDTSDQLVIGCSQMAGNSCQSWGYTNAKIDEVRISNISRSADYILATFKSINNTISILGADQSSSYISLIFNFSSINFGTLNASTTNNPATNNYEIVIETSACTNSYLEFDSPATPLTNDSYTIANSNFKFNYTINSTAYGTLNLLNASKNVSVIDKDNVHPFYFLTIPAGQHAGTYNTTHVITGICV